MVIKRFEVYLVTLDPTVGSEIQKLRPSVIISPDELNDNLATVIIAPMSSVRRNYPSHVNCVFDNVLGQVAIDQLRVVDKSRLKKKLSVLKDNLLKEKILDVLQRIFS